MNYNNFCKRIEKISKALSDFGCENLQFQKGNPASEKKVLEIEKILGINFPLSFRHALLEFSEDFYFSYNFADNIEFPGELRPIFCGYIYWKLDSFVDLEKSRKSWIETVFPDINNEYDKVWHNKLAFEEVPNGDMISFNISSVANNDPEIIYLSHDDGEGHGFRMADNFADLLEKWSSVAFVGNEDWQWIPFVNGENSGIVSDCKNAENFRELINLTL